MSRLQRFPLMEKEDIENSPSFRDGVPPAKEARQHKIAVKHMMSTAVNFRMSIFTCAIGVIMYRRFYTRRSLKQNSSYILAAACLFLASKVSDEPRGHQEISAELLKVWYGRPAARARLAADPAWTARLFALVLDGECSLLHALGFDFDVDLAHTRVLLMLHSPAAAPLRALPGLQQLALSTCNDIMRSDATLLLQYSAQEVALATLYFALKLQREGGATAAEAAWGRPAKAGCEQQPWFTHHGLTTPRCQEITGRFMERLYNRIPAAGEGGEPSNDPGARSEAGAASAALSTAGGASGPVWERKEPPLPLPPERESSPEEGELEEGELEA